MSRLLILLFLYFNYVFCVSYTDYSSSSSSEEITEPGSNRSKVCLIRHVETDHPLILKLRTTTIIYPNRHSQILTIQANTTVDFACPGNYNSLIIGENDTYESIVSATCDPDKLIPRNNYKWNQIKCAKLILASATYTGKWCGDSRGKLILVSFDIRHSSNLRIHIYRTCLNMQTYVPYYTYNKIDRIDRRWSLATNPMFRKDRLFSFGAVPTKSLYSQVSQRLVINAQVGLQPKSKYYIKHDYMHYLIPGCLVSPNDFYYETFRLTTYRYLNCVPMWRGIYYNNWKSIEEEIFTFTIQTGYHLRVWTGTHGIIKFLNLNSSSISEKVEIYLHSTTREKLFPIPKVLWKLVYHSKTKSAIVFVTENNPYREESIDLCPDITNQTIWLKLIRRKFITFGYSYVCEYSTLKEAVAYAPNIIVNNILT